VTVPQWIAASYRLAWILLFTTNMKAPLAALVLAAIAMAPMTACVDDGTDDAATEDTADLESTLPDMDDSKSDVAWIDFRALKNQINNIVQTFSATTGARYYATPELALANIEQTLRARGIANPRSATFVGYLATMPIPLNWHHSEFLIRGAVDTATGKVAKLGKRTVGDPNGAGVFDDQALTKPISPKMCMNWSMLEAAVRASYLRGTYSVDFVCHNDAMAVLKALRVAPEYFQNKVGGWKLAHYAYGPRASSGLSKDPARWQTTALCNNAAVQRSGL